MGAVVWPSRRRVQCGASLPAVGADAPTLARGAVMHAQGRGLRAHHARWVHAQNRRMLSLPVHTPRADVDPFIPFILAHLLSYTYVWLVQQLLMLSGHDWIYLL